MTTLLQALLRNESGGRNIPNVHQGTSSGQAQGYFQITTGTWNEFGGGKYAATPLQASYQQQADIASKIPLKRWDKSTLAAMNSTGRRIDPNRTLGENLAMHGEDFAGAGDTASGTVPDTAFRLSPSNLNEARRDSPSSGHPVGSKLPGPSNTYVAGQSGYGGPGEGAGTHFGGTGLGTPAVGDTTKPKSKWGALAAFKDMQAPPVPNAIEMPIQQAKAAVVRGEPHPMVDPQAAAAQRQALAQLLAMLNQNRGGGGQGGMGGMGMG